jgi:hypothetical protein
MIINNIKLKSPLMDFKEESFKLMMDLKNKMEIKKRKL